MHVPDVIDLPFRTETDGTIRIGSTRVMLDVVIYEYLNGSAPDEMAKNFDVLKPADVHLVIGYYLSHRAEVDAYLATRAVEAEELRRKLEALPSYQPLTVEMLEARLDAKRKQGSEA